MSNAEKTIPDCSGQAQRALLADRLRRAATRAPRLPLSFAQQRLWFLDQLEPNSPLYNIVTVARLTGSLHSGALEQALNTVLERHQALRTRFPCGDEGPEQVVLEHARIKLVRIELNAAAITARRKAAEQLIREAAHQPFDLSADLLLRASLIRLSSEEHLLVLVLHHIVADEWSLKILFHELGECYRSHVERRPLSLPPLAIQYSDFTVWQRNWLKGEVLGKQLEFWQRHLKGEPPVTELPPDHPRQEGASFRGSSRSRALGPELSRALTSLASNANATLFMVLLATFKALLFRYTRQEDIIVGSPIAGRNRIETEDLIGFFVNTLPLRTSVDGALTFEELLRRVRETTLGAFANQDLPFEKIVEGLRPNQSLSHMPFSKVMFALQREALDTIHWPGLTIEFLETESSTAKFEITCTVRETRHGLQARVEYNSDLFASPTIDRLLAHYANLLEGIVANPKQQVADLPLLGDAERKQLLSWGDHRAEYPGDRCLSQLFEEQVLRCPEAIAVLSEAHALTYRELNARANQLARYLKRVGLKSEAPVGLCVKGAAEMALGSLAVLKAGGTYVPLDPRCPKERLAFMLKDLQSPVLLTQQSLLGNIPRDPAEVVCLDAHWELAAREGRENLPVASSPESLAYIMFTSGSTGTPKGVCVPHRAVARLVLNTNYISIDSTDRIAQVSNPAFDAATFEIWGALLNGAQLVGITHDIALSPRDFARELRERKITTLFLTTALFNQLASEVPGAFESIRTLLFGGEAVDPKWVRTILKHQPPPRLVHVYGPTENTTFSTWHLVQHVPKGAATVPIGRPDRQHPMSPAGPGFESRAGRHPCRVVFGRRRLGSRLLEPAGTDG